MAAKKQVGAKTVAATRGAQAAPRAQVAARARHVDRAKPRAAGGPRAARLTLAQAMAALEHAGSPQTKKTYRRHGAREPLFGVSFATLQILRKRIGVDHELARALWATGNFDARNLAVKIADPASMTASELDGWARDDSAAMCSGYVGALASEGPHAMSRARAWLASRDVAERATGWALLGTLAMRDETTPDAWFLDHAVRIEGAVHAAPNGERVPMIRALISIGCRSAGLRKSAEAAARRIGPIAVDHGDTDCKTPDVATSIAKAWAHSLAKGYASPAAHERTRASMRLRC